MKRAQRKIKKQAKKGQKKAKVWKRDNKVMISIKDLLFKETSKKANRKIYWLLHNKRSDVSQCSNIKTVDMKKIIEQRVKKLKLVEMNREKE